MNIDYLRVFGKTAYDGYVNRVLNEGFRLPSEFLDWEKLSVDERKRWHEAAFAVVNDVRKLVDHTRKETMEGLIEGRIVHYVLDRGPSIGQHRPAIVVKVWSKEQGSVNLQVFVDGSNDDYNEDRSNDTSPVWVTSVTYSEEPNLRTWHWIEKA